MAESITLELNADGAWDGGSLTALNRDNAIITNQRYYKFNIAGPHGILGADLGGLFSPVSMKLVAIAFSSWSPESVARILALDAASSFRQEITLKPVMQFVVMYPGDRLAFLTKEERSQIVLVVNELNEAEAVKWAQGHEPFAMPTRFRIIRRTGVAFAPNPASTWEPNFHYDPSTGLLIAEEDATGMIPASSICLYPRWQGCYMAIRYAGSSGNGRVHIVDNTTRKTWIAESGLTDVKWSRAQFVSHDDGIALEASPAAPGQTMVADIEMALVHPRVRLGDRYAGGI